MTKGKAHHDGTRLQSPQRRRPHARTQEETPPQARPHHGCAGWRFEINGEQVSEGCFRRRYIAELERELDAAHEKLAAIYELI